MPAPGHFRHQQVASFRQPPAADRPCPSATAGAAQMVELSSGIDALYLSGRAALPGTLLDRLEEGRRLAEQSEGPVPFTIGGVELALLPHGFGKYRYCLRHEHAQIGVTPSKHLPALRIQPRTELLHALGPSGAIGWCRRLVADDVGPVLFTVSRLDLYADFQGWELCGDDRHRFVVRGRERDTYEDGEDLSGFVFGRRSSNTVLARIYDKQRDAKRKGADYWPGIWGPSYDAGRPVHRVEFELGRTGLRQYGVDTPDEAILAAGALWASLTESWLTYRSPTADRTRARWPVAPEWRAVQRASIRHGAAGLERIAEGIKLGSLRQLMPRLVGDLAAFAVLVGTERLAETVVHLLPAIHDLEARRGVTFAEKVAERRSRTASS
jgi:hypothetical protein